MPLTSPLPTDPPRGPATAGEGAPATAGEAGPAPRRVTLHTVDGVTLEGCWRSGADPRAVVVLVHGFAASHADRRVRELADRLHGEGFDVLAYDGRGHGGSGGECAVGSREHLDVASATEWVAGWGLPVVLVGVSMGAAAVVRHLACSTPATVEVAGAVLVSGPACWRMRVSPVGLLTAGLTRTAPGRWAAARWLRVRVEPGWRTGETPESMLARVPVPVAVVHGAGDRLLAPSHGRRLHSAAAGRSRLEVVEGMGHGLDGLGIAAAADAVRWVLASSRGTPVVAPVA